MLQHDVVREAEIVGRGERRRQTPASSDSHLGDLVADRLVFAAVIFGIVDLPASFHGAPDELEFLPGRQALSPSRSPMSLRVHDWA